MKSPTAIDDESIDRIAELVTVTTEEFGRTFIRAQANNDTVSDVAVIANLASDLPPVTACLRYARDRGFLRHLLRKAIDAQVAGSILQSNGRDFAELCRQRADVVASVDLNAVGEALAAMRADLGVSTLPAALTITQQGLNSLGFDADAAFMAAQLQSTMRAVCKIADASRGINGSGVLIAPHLVATAAHVVAPLLDTQTQRALPGSHENLVVFLDLLATTSEDRERKVQVADDWLAGVASCTIVPDATGKLELPAATDLVDSHDIAIIRLGKAPGLTRGWLDVTNADTAVEDQRRGLLFHHHPGGSSQAVSYGTYKGSHGSRFLHTCSSLPGSSGGPLINHRACLVGIHHGQIQPATEVTNLAGGGAWLAEWWRRNPQEHMPDSKLNPIWELRSDGDLGSGRPVIGFNNLQCDIWAAQRSGVAHASVIKMSRSAGNLLLDLVATMLPPASASVLRLRRAEIDREIQIAVDPTRPVTSALMRLADRLGLPSINESIALPTAEFATDAVQAALYVTQLVERLRRVQTTGPVWLLVHIEDKPLTSVASEALGHLYRAVAKIDGGRGKLLVVGSDDAILPAVEEMMVGTIPGPVKLWRYPDPDEGAVEQYILRWFKEASSVNPVLRDGVAAMSGLFLDAAAASGTTVSDGYAALCAVLRQYLDRLRGVNA